MMSRGVRQICEWVCRTFLRMQPVALHSAVVRGWSYFSWVGIFWTENSVWYRCSCGFCRFGMRSIGKILLQCAGMECPCTVTSLVWSIVFPLYRICFAIRNSILIPTRGGSFFCWNSFPKPEYFGKRYGRNFIFVRKWNGYDVIFLTSIKNHILKGVSTWFIHMK